MVSLFSFLRLMRDLFVLSIGLVCLSRILLVMFRVFLFCLKMSYIFMKTKNTKIRGKAFLSLKSKYETLLNVNNLHLII